jgi:hypothetical protein
MWPWLIQYNSMSRVSIVPNENSHKVVGFIVDSSNTNSSGKLI